jgi:hypothetical protein
MKTWENFEVQCTNFLNDKFGAYAKFIHKGGADSTTSDILVKTNSGKSFYIDAKHSPAQCGQFVLLPNLSKSIFEYSNKNATSVNKYSKEILDFMNENFNEFRDSGTTGKNISMPNGTDIFANWIIQTYQDKGTKFFITNNYTIFKIEEISDYFEVTAKYRIKRSGSRSIGKNSINNVIDYIISNDYLITSSYTMGSKLFVTSSRNLKNLKFILDDTEYMFSPSEDKYELRKLSNTYNSNVIFSVKQKSFDGMRDENFIQYLI